MGSQVRTAGMTTEEALETVLKEKFIGLGTYSGVGQSVYGIDGSGDGLAAKYEV